MNWKLLCGIGLGITALHYAAKQYQQAKDRWAREQKAQEEAAAAAILKAKVARHRRRQRQGPQVDPALRARAEARAAAAMEAARAAPEPAQPAGRPRGRRRRRNLLRRDGHPVAGPQQPAAGGACQQCELAPHGHRQAAVQSMDHGKNNRRPEGQNSANEENSLIVLRATDPRCKEWMGGAAALSNDPVLRRTTNESAAARDPGVETESAERSDLHPGRAPTASPSVLPQSELDGSAQGSVAKRQGPPTDWSYLLTTDCSRPEPFSYGGPAEWPALEEACACRH